MRTYPALRIPHKLADYVTEERRAKRAEASPEVETQGREEVTCELALGLTFIQFMLFSVRDSGEAGLISDAARG